MSLNLEHNNSIVDLSKYSTKESCYWLFNELNVYKYSDLAYTEPFCNYLMTWHKAVPLKAIVLAQSPYPNPIYPHTAAAMSYNSDLCMAIMKLKVPPTVEVLANDLLINANLDRDTTISVIKDGWKLVDSGMLLINEAVFCSDGGPESFKESVDQCNVLIRLLRETEKYGRCRVDLFALGQAGERMAGNLTSWFKSDIVKLSKHSVSHPASLSYRFSNLRDPKCHMGTPSFSKLLAKHIGNQVALLYTMAPNRSELELRIQSQIDAIRTSGEHLEPLASVMKEFIDMQQTLEKCTTVDNDEYKKLLSDISEVGHLMVTRMQIAAAASKNIEINARGIGSYVAKPGPSLSTTAPSYNAIQNHTGKERTAAQPRAMGAPVKFKKAIAPPTVSTSQATTISPPPSVISMSSSVASPSDRSKFKLRKAVTTPKGSTQQSNISTSNDAVSSIVSDNTEEAVPVVSSMGARFTSKLNVKQSPVKQEVKKSTVSPWAIPKDIINQLSSVEAVVAANGVDIDDDDVQSILDAIQNDISNKTMYNEPVKELVNAIKEDMKNIPNFDFVNWATDSAKPSATFNVCKSLFNF